MDVGAVYHVCALPCLPGAYPAPQLPFCPVAALSLACWACLSCLFLTAEACMEPEQSSNQESEAPDALAQPAPLSIWVDLGKLWFPPPWRGDIRPCPSICPGGGQQGSASQVGPETTLMAFFP